MLAFHQADPHALGRADGADDAGSSPHAGRGGRSTRAQQPVAFHQRAYDDDLATAHHAASSPTAASVPRGRPATHMRANRPTAAEQRRQPPPLPWVGRRLRLP